MTTKLAYPIITTSQKIRSLQYHYSHARKASEVLSQLTKQGKHKLTKKTKKQCDEYAVDIFGTRRYAPWLYVYSAFAGEFIEGWLPDNYYGEFVVPELKGNYGSISRLKPLNRTVFGENAFPDMLSYVNGVFFDGDGTHISPENVKDYLFRQEAKVIFKVDNSNKGQGIYIFNEQSFDVTKIPKIGNGLFQRYIRQHQDLSNFTYGSVATIRLTTVYEDDGTVSIRAGYLRLARDNESHVQSSTHIRVSFDLNTGYLRTVGHTTQWLPIHSHPDTDVEFAGKKIPRFNSCVELVKQCHRKAPHTRCIGWDLSVDYNGDPQIMEWNGAHNDIKYSEASQGPCFLGLNWERLITP